MTATVSVYSKGSEWPSVDPAEDLAHRRREREGFLWIALEDPDPDELENAGGRLGLHPLAIEDAIHGHERPKTEVGQGVRSTVLHTLSYVEQGSQVETSEVLVFIGEDFALTVRRGGPDVISTAREALTASRLQGHGPSAVLHAVADAVVDGYELVDAELERDMEELEARVFAPGRGSDSADIYALKREVLEFRRAASPLLPGMQRLHSEGAPLVSSAMRPFFRDVADHLLRTVDRIEGYDQLLTDVLNAHLAQVTVRQNEDMRRISAWVALAAVPTLLAGVWGMNFDNMPELGWEYGYPAGLGLMAVVCGSLYVAFRRSGWL